MKISDEKLKNIIRESVRQKAIEEGLFDDAVDFVSDKVGKIKSSIQKIFRSVGEFLNSLESEATEFSSSIIDELKKTTSDFIKSTLTDEDSQDIIRGAIKYFSSQEDIKNFLKENAANPNEVDRLFKYLKNKDVNIEDLSIKVGSKLIESGILEVDLDKPPYIFVKSDEKDAPEEIANALITSMEELNANFGLDFFTGGMIKSKRKIGKKIEKGATKMIIRRKLKKLFKNQ